MCKVLLVDDEYMILAGLKHLIPWNELGIELVGTATNGREALDFVLREQVDIVLSDITMPLLSGIDFLREAKKQQVNIKTIFLSGYQEFEFVKEGMSLGAVDYLVKPVDRNELVLALKKAIAFVQEESNKHDFEQLKFQQRLKEWVFGEPEQMLIDELGLLNRQSVNVFVGQYEETSFKEYLDKLANCYYFSVGEKQVVGIFLDYEKNELGQLYRQMAERFPKDVFVFAGTLKDTYLEIKKSYHVAISLRDSYYFYNLVQDGCIWLELTNQLEEIYYNSTDDLPFISKSERELSLHEKILQIIHYFERTPIPPNHARYFMLLILSDARAHYDLELKGSYQEEIDQIRNINNINEITATFLQLEEEIKGLLSQRSYSELTQKAIDLVHRDYQHDLILKEIAEALYVNPMYLGQLIRKETGQTFAQYLNSYRIKKAEEMLIKSAKTVNEIAHAVGYSSTGYFHKNFKEIYGITPKEFREKNLSI